MDARSVEMWLDETFHDASKLTAEQAKALGTVRGMLVAIMAADYAFVSQLFAREETNRAKLERR